MVTVSRGNAISIKGIRKLDDIVKWTGFVEEYLDSPRAMRPFIRQGFAGSVSDIEFTGQWGGGTVANSEWRRIYQPLSEFTEDKREERGYPRKQPILIQSGQLFQAGVVPFARWGPNTKRSSRSFNAPYGNHHNLKMVASNQGRRFHASISGPRVANQYGGPIRKPKGRNTPRLFLPPRPFWFLTEDRMQEGVQYFHKDLQQQWMKTASTMRLT